MRALEGKAIGFIGLGLMGVPMARNLRKAGAQVVISNRSPQIVRRLAAEGFQCADSPAGIAKRCDTIICMVSDTDAVEQVALGEAGVLTSIRRGAIMIDMGTTDIDRTRQIGSRFEAAGASLVDAPVSGGQTGAENASLSIMVGASDSDFLRVHPILNVLGAQVVHVGEVGAGQIAKAANQIIVGLTIGAVAEAFALARHGGADLDKVRQALQGGFASSQILEVHGQRMIESEYEPGGKSSTQRKDLHQALCFAKSLGIQLPATELCLKRYDELIENGGGSLDHSALFTLY